MFTVQCGRGLCNSPGGKDLDGVWLCHGGQLGGGEVGVSLVSKIFTFTGALQILGLAASLVDHLAKAQLSNLPFLLSEIEKELIEAKI